MFKEKITYVDYNGVERTEDFYFNLTEAEIMEMEMGTAGGYAEMIQKIVDAKDAVQIIKVFKELLLMSYGVKTADGRRFIKNDEIRDEFAQTEAFSIMFMHLSTDSDYAAKFVEGVMPANAVARVKEEESRIKNIPAPKQ